MRFGKRTMFLALNSLVLLVVLLYCGVWLFGRTATGSIMGTSLDANIMTVQYEVAGKRYSGRFMRHGLPLDVDQVEVRYLPFDPHLARVNSFLDLWAEPLGWMGLFLFASSVLLLTNNSVFARGTVFQLHKRFPWISMEEYFPEAGEPQPQGTPRQRKPRPPGPKLLRS